MAVPDFQTIMLPLLQMFSDDRIHQIKDLVEPLADKFGLTQEQRAEMLPSGRQQTFRNRIAWSRTYLTKAGLLERTGRGAYRITQRGRLVLQNPPSRIDINFLNQYPEFVDFRARKNSNEQEKLAPTPTASSESTPFEILESSYHELRKELAQDLLDEVKSSPPEFFEQLVIDLLVAMGYGGSRSDAGQAVGGSGDGGIDGIIKEDRLGLDAIYLQAKRWENPVSRPVVQAFAGSLEGHRARKGVMITTSTFSRDAHHYVGLIEKKIVLIDGEQLAQLMIDHGIGVTEVQTYSVYRIDSDYFSEE
jgi:restriction system protein